MPLVLVNVQTNSHVSILQLLKKISPLTWISVFLFLLIYEALDAGINQFLESLFRSSEGTPNWVWLIAGFSVLINILFPVTITFWLLSSVKAVRSWQGDFQQLLIETLRVWGKILLYTLALIIPGLWKWVSSLFVPFVVLFSKRYNDGEVDAIAASRQIFTLVWVRTLLTLIVFSLLIPYFLTTVFNEYQKIWEHPVGAVLLGAAEYLCIIVSLFYLLNLFIKASREVHNELIF